VENYQGQRTLGTTCCVLEDNVKMGSDKAGFEFAEVSATFCFYEPCNEVSSALKMNNFLTC
jgi:hypothetical protein